MRLYLSFEADHRRTEYRYTLILHP